MYPSTCTYFCTEIFRGCLFSWYSMNWLRYLSTSNKWVQKSKGSIWMGQHFRWSSIWMGLFFQRPGILLLLLLLLLLIKLIIIIYYYYYYYYYYYMNGVGFEILARTPVPQLPPSTPPPTSPPWRSWQVEKWTCSSLRKSKVRSKNVQIFMVNKVTKFNFYKITWHFIRSIQQIISRETACPIFFFFFFFRKNKKTDLKWPLILLAVWACCLGFFACCLCFHTHDLFILCSAEPGYALPLQTV